MKVEVKYRVKAGYTHLAIYYLFIHTYIIINTTTTPHI